MKAESERQAVGVDDIQRLPPDEDRGEGDLTGSMQPKMAGLEGIEVCSAFTFRDIDKCRS